MKSLNKINPAGKITISFIVVILIGAFLLCLPISSKDGLWFPFIDSIFTATSAVCVTGLIVVDTAVHFSLFGQIVIMLLIQIGGLGFITISSLVFVLLGKKLSYKSRLTIQESLNQDNNEGILKLVKEVIILVFSCEFVGFICLLPSFINMYGVGQGVFTAMFLSISAFCNAGFDVIGTQSTMFQNLEPLRENVFIILPIVLLIILGGIGHIVIFEIIRKQKNKKLSLHSKIVLISTMALIIGGTILFALMEWNNPNTIGELNTFNKILNSLFQSVTPRTAGFSTINQGNLTAGSIILTDLLMFIGGSPGSIAGGVKTTTIFVLILVVFKGTNSKGDVVYKNKKISNSTILKSLRVFSLAIVFIICSVFAITIIENGAFTLSEILFEVISAISTVGISLGITTSLSIGSKIIISMLMFVGRVGTLTITMAISKNKDENKEIEYLDSKIMVG